MHHMPFGAFNPRFHGISLFSDSDRLGWLKDYESAPDPRGWSAATGEPELDQIISISAPEHESRHFHDFLVSPIGLVTMGQRMQASIAGLQAINLMKKCAGRWIPAPVGRWLHWDETQRRRWVSDVGGAFGFELDDVVALPHSPPDTMSHRTPCSHQLGEHLCAEQQLSEQASAAAGAYRFLEVLRSIHVDDLDIHVNAHSVFEASAHLVQMQAIYTGQSAQAAQIFQHFLETASMPHLDALRTIWGLLHHASGAVSVDRLCELFTWMMLGPTDRVLSSGHPAVRCGGVIQLARARPDHAIFTEQASTETVFDTLDALFGEPDWRANIWAASDGANRRIAQYNDASIHLRGGYFDGLFEVARHWHRDQAAARSTFLADPGTLAQPLRYIQDAAYPHPLFELQLPNGMHQRTEPLDSPSARALAVDEAGLQVIAYTCQPPGIFPAGLLDAAHQTRIATHWIDFAFQDDPVMNTFDQHWRQQLGAYVGKEIVSLME